MEIPTIFTHLIPKRAALKEDAESLMKLHRMHYWMMFHTALLYTLVSMSLSKIEGLFGGEWDTLKQLWIWNLFAYLYVVFMHYMHVFAINTA